MSRDYFIVHPEKVATLERECESWFGTPFRKHSCVKGPFGGIDCENYLPACLFAVDAIDAATLGAIKVPPYELEHSEHSTVSLFHDWFRQPAVRARVRRVDEDEPHADGDFVFPKVGQTEHHIGFRVRNQVYHVGRPGGPCRQSIGTHPADLQLERSRYRLMEVAP